MNDIQIVLDKCKNLVKIIEKGRNCKVIENKRNILVNRTFFSILFFFLLFPIMACGIINKILLSFIMLSFLGIIFLILKKVQSYEEEVQKMSINIEESIKNCILTNEPLIIKELLLYDKLYQRNLYKNYIKNKKEKNYFALFEYLSVCAKKIKKLESKEKFSSLNKNFKNEINIELEQNLNHSYYNL